MSMDSERSILGNSPMSFQNPPTSEITALLKAARTIAVLGLSDNPARTSCSVSLAMQRYGYRIIPVNPNYQEVLGQTSFKSLADIGEPVDIVDCFRKSEEMVPIAQAAVANGARVLWMQLGVISEQAARIATDAGMAVVMNRCVKIEHARLLGGLNWAGVNTGVISAKRLA